MKTDLRKKVKKDLLSITSKKKFLNNANFESPSIMGILNLTPTVFPDGGKFNKSSKSFKHISNMISSGANIIDVGGESTRPPGSKTINSKIDRKEIRNSYKKFQKNTKRMLIFGYKKN